MRKAFFVSILAALALPLVACGGGGGGGPIPVVNPSQPPIHTAATLGGGFASGGSSAQSSQTRRAMSDPTLTGAILPFAVFAIPDSNVKGNSSTIGYTAVAYLDTSNGSTLPTTVPTVLFTENNSIVPLSSVVAVPTPSASSPIHCPGSAKASCYEIAAQDLQQPTTTGETVITATASGTFGSVNMTADAYHAMAMDVTNPNPAYNPPPGNYTQVSFDPSGSPQYDPMNPDLKVSLDSNGVPTLLAPNGIVAVNKPISAVTAADFVAVPPTSVAGNGVCVNGSQTNGNQVTTYLIRTKGGSIVAWEADGLNGSNLEWTDGNCNWESAYGPYRSL